MSRSQKGFVCAYSSILCQEGYCQECEILSNHLSEINSVSENNYVNNPERRLTIKRELVSVQQGLD